LVRAGQTEGSVDLSRLAGLNPGGVICEIINDDGDMARFADLQRFASEHQLRIVTIADLIAYRLQTERLVERVIEQELVLDLTDSKWTAIVFQATLEDRQLLALVKGALEPTEPALCRMHAGSILADTFSSTTSDGAHNLKQAILAIEAAGSGVVVYLPPKGNLQQELGGLLSQQGPPASGQERPHGGTLREYGLGAQVLRELGLREIRLLTNNPRKIAGIHGYGLHVVDTVALEPAQIKSAAR
jgi:3,4-dihydroxy 2-butanone 4-phosphate synthase/GTP cyclohydrolase II